ncbi:hypothetical protein [Mucilaginibacter sp. PAMB04168]|uniref:hypothetical protein n=1 Tax=Mucilaginibacter sp. PAMB04168 TaxID=3138567 RepID=UPI0031F65915
MPKLVGRLHSFSLFQYTDNYGEAGALKVCGKRYGLPKVICLNSNFALWAFHKPNADHMSCISDDNDVNDMQLFAWVIQE